MHRRITTEKINQPLAGASPAFVPAGGAHVRLQALTGILTTDATVANRIVALQFATQSGDVYWSSDVVIPQTASLAVRYSWAIGTGLAVATALVGGERVTAPLPHLWLGENDKVSIVTGAEDTSDQWSSLVWRGVVDDDWDETAELVELAQAFTAVHG